MKNNFMKTLAVIAIIAVLVCLIVALIGAIGSMKMTDGCLLRYNLDDSGRELGSTKIIKTTILKANGNYTIINTPNPDGRLDANLDPNRYGEWLNTNLLVKANEVVQVKVKGDVSLCRAYVPKNNIQSTSDLDNDNKRIPIPKIEESESNPVSLIFDAKTDEWRNISELYKNDQIIVALHKEKKEVRDAKDKIVVDVQNITMTDIFTKNIINTDCREDKRTYSPLCGRYSIYGGTYVSGCEWRDDCYECNCRNKCVTVTYHYPWHYELDGRCLGDEISVCERCGCWSNVTSQAPEPYKNDGRFTAPWSDNLGDLFTDFNPQCSDSSHIEKDKNYILGEYQNKRHFWFTSNEATGLLYRFDSSETPTNARQRGTVYNFTQVLEDQSDYNNNPDFNIIYKNTFITGDKAYLQYRFHDNDGVFADNTGGYVLNIKQTKCRRSNGAVMSDIITNRGKIEYLILPAGDDPNVAGTTIPAVYDLATDANGAATITANDNSGSVWMRIFNNADDYKDSTGQYNVEFSTTEPIGNFSTQILTPLFETLKGKITDASKNIFKNMTCYGDGPNGTTCTNFFNYIKAMLTLYIMVYGALFLLGMVQISQTDLVIRTIKIAIVAGLMNEKTFEMFNIYVFDFVTGFSDQVVSNISGYSLFTTGGRISNPFMFLDSLMTKVFFSKTFMAQLLALISMGISGLLYFIIIFIALMIVIITTLRAIAVYLMAYFAIAVLLGLAPLFLTFMLFDFTRYLFDNWVKFTIRYMIEPAVMLAGIIILTQLFTIYLDFVVGYSVCWKCALPIKIPFPGIPGLDFAFTNVELFCINWFAPWGFDHRTGMMGINMQHMIALVMIAYCMYGYLDLSGKIVVKLTGGIGGPSATQMGQDMSSAMEESAMSSVGLDKDMRDKITSEVKQRVGQKLSDGVGKLKKGQGAKNSGKKSGDNKDSKDGSGESAPSAPGGPDK